MMFPPRFQPVALALGLACLAAFPAAAVPVIHEPNRDVVRNPYGPLLSELSGSPASAVVAIDSGGTLLPATAALANAGSGGGSSGFAPSLGGGAGGLPGLSTTPSGPGGGPSIGTFPGSPGAPGSTFVPGPPSLSGPLSGILPPPGNPGGSGAATRPAGSSEAAAVAALEVPDGGETIIFLGCGLLALFMVRRRLVHRWGSWTA